MYLEKSRVWLSCSVACLNLGKFQGLLALQLVGDVVATVLAMIESPVPAWLLVIDELRNRAQLDVVARSIEGDHREPVGLFVGDGSVLHAPVPAIRQDLRACGVDQQRIWWQIKMEKKTRVADGADLDRVTDVDDESIGDGVDGHPGVVFENLQADGCRVLLQHGQGAAIGVRAEPQNEVWPRAWRVVVHPYGLHRHAEHLVEVVWAQSKAPRYEHEQNLAEPSYAFRVLLQCVAVIAYTC